MKARIEVYEKEINLVLVDSTNIEINCYSFLFKSKKQVKKERPFIVLSLLTLMLKYKLVYDGLVEYTLDHRSFPKQVLLDRDWN